MISTTVGAGSGWPRTARRRKTSAAGEAVRAIALFGVLLAILVGLVLVNLIQPGVIGQEAVGEVGADEAGGSGDQYFHG